MILESILKLQEELRKSRLESDLKRIKYESKMGAINSGFQLISAQMEINTRALLYSSVAARMQKVGD